MDSANIFHISCCSSFSMERNLEFWPYGTQITVKFIKWHAFLEEKKQKLHCNSATLIYLSYSVITCRFTG